MKNKVFFIVKGLLFLLLLCTCKKEESTKTADQLEDNSQKQPLVIYTALDDTESSVYFNHFTKETGIPIDFIRKSSNEIRNLLKMEQSNPVASVIYGGTTDLFVAATQDGLFEPYRSPGAYYLSPPFRDADYHWSGIYIGAIGFATNTEKNLPPPASWYDLLKPEYKGQISMANPASSGTAYTIVATLIQIMGKEEAFEYMEKLNSNIAMYTNSGSGPAKLCGMGEIGIGISFHHDILKVKSTLRQPVVLTFPKEGVGYEIGAIALVKNAPMREAAQRFIDFALSKDCQKLYNMTGYFRLPLNPDTELTRGSIPISEINIIDYDFDTYGKLRDEITEEWNRRIPR